MKRNRIPSGNSLASCLLMLLALLVVTAPAKAAETQPTLAEVILQVENMT